MLLLRCRPPAEAFDHCPRQAISNALNYFKEHDKEIYCECKGLGRESLEILHRSAAATQEEPSRFCSNTLAGTALELQALQYFQSAYLAALLAGD